LERNQLRPILREKFPRERTYLLPVLHFVQEEVGHLPDWALQTVAWHIRVPASEVYGAATSYSELRLSSIGNHIARVCAGLSCWTNGGQELLESLSQTLGIQPGETTPDGKVTLEKTQCGFLCAVAPAIEVDHKWLGRGNPQKITAFVQGLT
jgi:NADH-quinone oxidoreductase subunit E